MKSVFRRVLGEHLYEQVRVSLLANERGLGLGWRWCNSLRTVYPIRRDFGWQAGRPIDRYYTEELFLSRYASDVRGHVLEIGDCRYTRMFGGANVLQSDVLTVKPVNNDATVVADLTSADQIPSDTFDCAILTFTLQFIYDVKAAIRTVHRILKPGGVLLAVVPGMSQIARYDDDNWGEFWRFTSRSLQMLVTEVFPVELVTVQSYGNVLAAVASLHGLIATELKQDELNFHDRDYELVVTLRAVKEKTVS